MLITVIDRNTEDIRGLADTGTPNKVKMVADYLNLHGLELTVYVEDSTHVKALGKIINSKEDNLPSGENRLKVELEKICDKYKLSYTAMSALSEVYKLAVFDSNKENKQ